MIKSILYLATGLVAISSIASAEEDPSGSIVLLDLVKSSTYIGGEGRNAAWLPEAPTPAAGINNDLS
jgi:hypothetical protein